MRLLSKIQTKKNKAPRKYTRNKSFLIANLNTLKSKPPGYLFAKKKYKDQVNSPYKTSQKNIVLL